MREMTGLLDANELNAVINMEVESDDEDTAVGRVSGPATRDPDMDQMFEVEYDDFAFAFLINVNRLTVIQLHCYNL